MYMPTGFVPVIYFTEFTYSFHWAGDMFYHLTHKSDIFYFFSLSSTPNQAEEAQQFFPPREFWGDYFIQ